MKGTCKHESEIFRFFPNPAVLLSMGLLVVAGSAAALDVPDPGKDHDYVFWGYSAAHGPGGPDNRIMFNQDIDDDASPVPNSQGPKFRVVAASPAFGRVDGIDTQPGYYLLIPRNSQKSNPERFIIRHNGTDIVWSNSALEANQLHYLRAVVDVRHDNRRTRFTANCPVNDCEEP